jgi:hypothetical protein
MDREMRSSFFLAFDFLSPNWKSAFFVGVYARMVCAQLLFSATGADPLENQVPMGTSVALIQS